MNKKTNENIAEFNNISILKECVDDNVKLSHL